MSEVTQVVIFTDNDGVNAVVSVGTDGIDAAQAHWDWKRSSGADYDPLDWGVRGGGGNVMSATTDDGYYEVHEVTL